MKIEEEKSTELGRATNIDDVISFAYGVLADLGFEDWLVDWSKASPSICIHSSKRIFLSERDLLTQPMWYALQYVLHEIAHIDTYDGRGCGHTTRFFSRNAELILRYLGDVRQLIEQEKAEMAKELFEGIICPLCYIVNPHHATENFGKGCDWCQEKEDWCGQALKSKYLKEE